MIRLLKQTVRVGFCYEKGSAEDEKSLYWIPVTLITRPRRFGKTLNMNMLECFFSVAYAGRASLFEGLSIWEEETYRSLQGNFPVIALSFADIKGSTFETAWEEIIPMRRNI